MFRGTGISILTEAVIAISRMMKLTVASALFCAVLCSYYASCVAYTYKDCGSTLAKFTNVSISDCHTTNATCRFTTGKSSVMTIKFIPNADIPQVKARVYGTVYNVTAPMSLEKPDVCQDPHSEVQCPLRKNQEYSYTTIIAANTHTQTYNLDIKWELVNAYEEKIVCVHFPAQIVDNEDL